MEGQGPSAGLSGRQGSGLKAEFYFSRNNTVNCHLARLQLEFPANWRAVVVPRETLFAEQTLAALLNHHQD